jgi:LuxR family transcriptional regulator, maltose regulon positive regulatory protein
VAHWATGVSTSEHFPACLRRDAAYRTYAGLLLAQQYPQQALDLLTTMEDWERACGHDGHLAPIHALQALAHQALGQEGQMLVCLERAVALAAPEDERRIFLDIGPPIIALLPLVRHVAPTFVDQVVSDSGIEGAAPPQHLVESLSEREREIVRLIAAGLSNEEAASELMIASGTVKKHLDNIYGKLGVHRRTQAVARAHELHLV